MTTLGTQINVFLWSEAEIETSIQSSGKKLLTIAPEGGTVTIFFMAPAKLDELILKLQELKELKGGEQNENSD